MERMKFCIDSYSDVGSRKVNEDALAVVCTDRILAAMVADGLGGVGYGDVAAEAAAQVIRKEAGEMTAVTVESVTNLCLQMNAAVLRRQTDQKRMKSTFAAVFYDGGTMVFAHAGDSRIYHFRKNKILYQSRDHSVSQLAVLAGEIRPKDIRFHIDRNKVLRSLGVPEEEFRPEIRVSEYLPVAGDALLICSDGFWEHVTEREMLASLKRYRDAALWLRGMRRRMLWKCIKEQDNHSAIALICQ